MLDPQSVNVAYIAGLLVGGRSIVRLFNCRSGNLLLSLSRFKLNSLKVLLSVQVQISIIYTNNYCFGFVFQLLYIVS